MPFNYEGGGDSVPPPETINFEKLSPDEIDNLKVEKEKELIEAERAAAVVKDEVLGLSRKILEIRIKKNALDAAYEQARFLVKRLQSDIKILTSKFWGAKNR
jgi:peptidoglycan hydrolase CwlO-like protein